VRDIKMRLLRRHIGMVLQDSILFSGTIKENILYGKPDATNEALAAACKAANAYEFIRNLPNGFDTEVSEGGGLLSGGQRQRITAAGQPCGPFRSARRHVNRDLIHQTFGKLHEAVHVGKVCDQPDRDSHRA